MKTLEIRKAFLAYFIANEHKFVETRDIIPHNDSSLLFVNAGMVPFKNAFLGLEPPPAPCVTSVQGCVRAGGKHNDLENVGYTARHHTFFEMLGNFSFGKYFKREAIALSWRFLTEVLALPAEKLWVTVYNDDQETTDIWLKEVGVDPSRFSQCGEEDNFWSMGSVGPCGPCTEIFYDHGSAVAGGPPGSQEAEGDRYVEIWNIVFMQYNRDESGALTTLPRPCVDTGMGVERIAAVLQGVHDNYDIDIFQVLIQALMQITPSTDKQNKSLRVIVDHIRSTCFIILSGVMPANVGRGYLLRRILRRAIRHGYQQGQRTPFFHKLVSVLGEVMGEAYPELIQQKAHLEKVILQEEQRFFQTLEKGIGLFNSVVEQLTGNVVPGQLVFELYDTYGFPPDLTADMVRERNLVWDEPGFVSAMESQKARSRKNSFFSSKDHALQLPTVPERATFFRGYDTLSLTTHLLHLVSDKKQLVQHLQEGEYGYLIIEETPFYPESGGQVGDKGKIATTAGLFEVQKTFRVQEVIYHYGQVKQGEIVQEHSVLAQVSQEFRKQVACHHSATHLLHAGLRAILGDSVQQKGSLVIEDKLRFDFSYNQPLTELQKHAIEDWVNKAIVADVAVKTVDMSFTLAQQKGAIALFSEKYAENVRVVRMGEFSYEVCGGTHVGATGEIGAFFICSEGAVASGVRRIEAIAGVSAIEWAKHTVRLVSKCARKVQVIPEKLEEAWGVLLEKQKRLAERYTFIEQKYSILRARTLLHKVEVRQGISIIITDLEGMNRPGLRTVLDVVSDALKQTYIILLAAVEGESIHIVSAVSPDCIETVSAVELLKVFAKVVGGKGGGKSSFAQGGGQDCQKLPLALQSAQDWIDAKLSAY